MQDYPRKLSKNEKSVLFSILLENKTGYKSYKDKIEKLLVIGKGRFGGSNLILGKEGAKPDLSFPSSPVFASGVLICNETKIDVIIHEEIDDEIEFDISTNNDFNLNNEFSVSECWSYSEWIPGKKAPGDNSIVREIKVVPGKYILAIASAHKKIWLYDFETGINHLIPLSNFYNQLMMVKEIRDSKIALNPGSFFGNLDQYSDTDLISALITYNKYLRRFKLDIEFLKEKKTQPVKKNIFSFLKRG